MLTLHDGIDAQRDYAELHKTTFQPWSHFGDYRHNYQKVVPTLKYFSASTFFASFLEPLTYEQLEAREGTLGATYCPDLLDLLLGLFSYMGIVPPLHFGANIDALKGRRFQYATYGPPAPAEGRTIKEYAVRLAPATQAAAGEGSAPPTSLAPPQYGAYFCSDSMLEPLKRYGINPKTRSRDGYAIKLHPLPSCDSQAIADAIAHSPLRGPQADTLLLVDIPSTRGSHTWILTANGLLGTYIAPIPPSHFHSAWQDPAQPMWTNPERHGTSSASVLPTYFPNVYLQLGTTISMFKPMVALLHTSAKRPLLIFWRKMPNQTKS